MSQPFSLEQVEKHLRNAGTFDAQSFNLPDPGSDWLDAEVAMSADSGAGLEMRTNLFEGRFPLQPGIDREGTVFTSFQRSLTRRILSLRNRVVERSGSFLDIGDWFQDLRSLISECTSLVDMTLHQLYFQAEYAPQPGWAFDKSRLGERHGRRMSDKIKWVRAITQRDFHADAELKAFRTLKDLRNHLQHFDPPCLAFTIEHDVVDWVNMVPTIGELLMKMRRCMRAPISAPLAALVLAPRVEFVPRPEHIRRKPIDRSLGYASSCWKKK